MWGRELILIINGKKDANLSLGRTPWARWSNSWEMEVYYYWVVFRLPLVTCHPATFTYFDVWRQMWKNGALPPWEPVQTLWRQTSTKRYRRTPSPFWQISQSSLWTCRKRYFPTGKKFYYSQFSLFYALSEFEKIFSSTALHNERSVLF